VLFEASSNPVDPPFGPMVSSEQLPTLRHVKPIEVSGGGPKSATHYPDQAASTRARAVGPARRITSAGSMF